MADSDDQPSRSDSDLDRSELKVVGSKQRLAKQVEVEVMEDAESSRTGAVQQADNGEDQSPNSDESERTVVDAGEQFDHSLFLLCAAAYRLCLVDFLYSEFFQFFGCKCCAVQNRKKVVIAPTAVWS